MEAPRIEYESGATRGGMHRGQVIESGWGKRLALAVSKLALSPVPFLIVGGVLYALLYRPLRFLAPPVVTIATLFGVIVGMAALAQLSRTIRRRRGALVLSYVEQAVRLNFPLPQMIRAACAAETGPVRKRLLWLAEMVEAGAPLGAALEYSVPEVPGRAVELTKAAERVGRLPATLHRLVGENRRHTSTDPTSSVLNLAYPVTLTAFLLAVVLLVATFVMPKYQQILRDFNMPMPPLTIGLLDVLESLGPLLAGATALLVLLYTGQRLWEVFGPVSRRPRALALTDRLLWSLPLAHRIARDRGLADACSLIAEAAEAGHPLDRAVAETTELRLNAVLIAMLRKWGQGLQDGLPPDEASRRAGLPPLVAGMISTAHAAGGPRAAEAFRFLSSYYEGRFSRAALLIKNAVAPAIAIGFGIIVAVLAWGMFAPMIRLTERLSLDVGRL